MLNTHIFVVSCLSILLQMSHCYILHSNGGNKIYTNSTQKYLRVCYYSFGDPTPDQLNATLCTHIIAGFSSVKDGVFNVGTKDVFQRYLDTVALKKIYPGLKVMVSIGGGGNNAPFSDAVSTQYKRNRLLQSCLNFLIKYNVDGLDIDWEFPVWNDAVPADKKNFVMFLQEFRKITTNTTNPLLLSVAVAAPQNIIDESYNVPLMAKYVDFINLMSYDYHDFTFYTPFTGHNSPLFNRSVEHAYFATLNTAWSAMYWNKLGMPKEKIMVGLPTYGHTYALLDPKLHDIDSPAVGFGIGNGSITFPEVCTFLLNGGTRVFNVESQVPYAYKNYDWIGYDDNVSILAKVKWVQTMEYGGVMTFDLNCDDWEGVCDGKTKFPLHQIIYNILSSP